MHLQSLSMKSTKTTEKETRSCTGNPGFPMNHAITQKHYSYESWLRIWNPRLFLILTRGPFLHPLYQAEENIFFWRSRLHVFFIKKKSRKKRQVTDTKSSQVIQGLPLKPRTQTKARNTRGILHLTTPTAKPKKRRTTQHLGSQQCS